MECSQVILSLLSERPHGLISFVGDSPNADLGQVLRDGLPCAMGRHRFGRPAAGAKKLMASWLTEPCAVHLVCYVILVLFCGVFRYFRRFGVFFELVFHSEYIREKNRQSMTAPATYNSVFNYPGAETTTLEISHELKIHFFYVRIYFISISRRTFAKFLEYFKTEAEAAILKRIDIILWLETCVNTIRNVQR